MEIRPLTEDDADAFWALRLEALKLHPEAFGSSYEESKDRSIEQVHEQMRARSTAGDNFIVGAFDGELLGVVGFYREGQMKTRHRGWIWGVYVRPQARREHVGRRLMDEAITRIRRIEGMDQVHLGVSVQNTPAVKLYRSVGFEEYGVEPRSLKVGESYYDEALMLLKLR